MNEIYLKSIEFDELKEGEFYLVHCVFLTPPYKVCEFNGNFLTLAHNTKKVKESEIEQIYLITN